MLTEAGASCSVTTSTWSAEEQALLEDGLARSASLAADPKRRWAEVARIVGTRDAAACEERFRSCRAEAIQEDEQDEEGEETGDEDEDCAHSGAAGSSASKNTWTGWNAGWSGRGWQSGRGRGGRWKAGDWSASASWGSWHGGDSWRWSGAVADEDDTAQDSAEPCAAEVETLDECQRRALEMRKEVEANRERLRLKEERQAEEQRRKDEKKSKEVAEKMQKRQEHIEKQEQLIREKEEAERHKKEQEEQRIKELQRQAAKSNSAFAPVKVVGGKARNHGGWAAKASSSNKGMIMRQRKEEELEKRSREALEAIGASSCPPSNKKAEKEEADCDASERHVVQESSHSDQPSSQASAKPMAAPPKAPSSKVAARTPAPLPLPQHAEAHSSQSGRPPKKRWWAKLEGECPISLALFSQMPRPPFALMADGSSIPHYFDARFLANYLLSSCDFIDPVNRRSLTLDECQALDAHLARNCLPGERPESSVADAFALFQKHGSGGESPVHGVQREATAVLQHLFRFESARRTDRRGRAIQYAEGGLTVVDDDDILAAPPPAPAPPERTVSNEYPQLGASAAASSGNPAAGPPKGPGWSAKARPGQSYNGSPEVFPSLGGSTAKAKAWGKSAAAPQPKSKGRGKGKAPAWGNSGQGDAW